MKKKNDKIKIIFIVFVLYFILSWIIEGGIYSSSGEFTSVGIVRMGLFDLVSIIYSAFYYRTADIMFLLAVGGSYQVLLGTLKYRKLVDKVSNFIKGKEEWAMVLLTTVIAIIASLTNNVLIFFVLAPFIVTVFLRNNYNRLTAFSAGFGGMFLGYLGLTFGTYNVGYINDNMALGASDWIIQKWVILAIAVILFNIFSVLYMKKHKNMVKDQSKYDLFATEPVMEEKTTKKNKKKEIKCWPLVLVFILMFVTMVLGYISWTDSFNVEFFNNLFTSMTNNLLISDVSLFGSVFGSRLTAFGTWVDLVVALFVLLVGIIVMALICRVKFNDFITQFGIGMKKMAGVAFIYGFATASLFLISMFPWAIGLVKNLFGSGSFNIIILFIIAIIATIFVGDGSLCGYLFSAGLAALYSNNLVATAVIWRVGSAVATIAAPTSVLLLASLTYLNIPYKNWIKYIWKFAALFSLVVLIFLAVVIYV